MTLEAVPFQTWVDSFAFLVRFAPLDHSAQIEEAKLNQIYLPDDVLAFLENIFEACNLAVSRKISKMPNVHETSLDMTFIEHLSNYSAPVRLGSGWTVRLDTYYLGGGRHFGSWEIADIGFLVMFRQAGQFVRSKVALLQSKRLYPTSGL